MYRAELLRCGYCSTPMDVVPVPVPHSEAAATDVCPACLAVFLEYFDGEPIGIARGLLALRPELELDPDQDPGAPAPDAQATKSSIPEPGPAHCPGCGGAEVTPLRYLDGPLVSRCHDCLSLSATREQFVRLAQHHMPRESQTPREGLWARLRRYIHSW